MWPWDRMFYPNYLKLKRSHVTGETRRGTVITIVAVSAVALAACFLVAAPSQGPREVASLPSWSGRGD